MRIVFLGIFLLLLLPLQAADLPQARSSSYYHYIYQLSNEQALEFLKKKRIPPGDTSFFQQLVDSFPPHEKPPVLPVPGHYLLIRILNEKLEAELISRNNINIQFLDNNRDLSLVITGLDGQPLEALHPRVRNYSIPFDSRTRTYLHPGSRLRGWLTVVHDRHLNIQHIDRSSGGRSIFASPPFSFVAQLADYAISIPLDLFRSIEYRHLSGIYQNILSSPEYRGYMVLNKPRYRPGETVHYKAYITDSFGRPYKGNLDLMISRPRKKALLLATISHYRPGAYEGAFLIHDSLELALDSQYTVYLKRKWHTWLASSSFNFSDYELKNIRLKVNTGQGLHYRGKDLTLQVSGNDENDLPLLDARLDYVIYPKEIKDLFSQYGFILDTLFNGSIPLDTKGPSSLKIPDSLFPDVNLQYEIQIKLVDGTNQVAHQTHPLTFYHKRLQLDYQLRGKEITFFLRRNGISHEASATLEYLNEKGNPVSSRTVELPYTEAISTGLPTYRLSTGTLVETFSLKDEHPGIEIRQIRSPGRLTFEVENNLDLPFSWFLYKNGMELSAGSDTVFSFSGKTRQQDEYLLRVYFLWAGVVNSLFSASALNPYHLNIAVEQPEQIFPGQQATIAIQVTDRSGKPVKGADITAFSWTRKFDQKPQMPPSRHHSSRNWASYNRFSSGVTQTALSVPLFQHYGFFSQRAGLDTMEYFRFRYPGGEPYTSSTETYTGITQLAPFILKAGKKLPIEVIWLNNEPVYIGSTTHARPWAFRAKDGYNQLQIRTRSELITLDSLYLEAGKKTFISLDIEKNSNLQLHKAKARPTRQEKKTLNPLLYSFNLAGGHHNNLMWLDLGEELMLLNKDPRNFFFGNQSLAGPLKADSLLLAGPGGNSSWLHLRNDLTYWISSQGLQETRLYRPSGFRTNRWKSDFTGRLNDEVLTLELLRENMRIIELQSSRNLIMYSFPATTTWGKGKLNIRTCFEEELLKQWGYPLHIILLKEGSTVIPILYPGSQTLFHDLDEGNYSLVFVFPRKGYLQKGPFYIRSNGNNLYSLDVATEPSFHEEYHELFLALQKSHSKAQEYGTWQVAANPALLFQSPAKAVEAPGSTSGMRISGYLSGKVVDATDNFPLPGATVTVEGTTMGTVTDIHGNFSLPVPQGVMVRVSFIGMQSQVFVPEFDYYEIRMQPDILRLEEVVVTGYGVSRRSLSGAVSGIQVRSTSSVYGSKAAYPPPPVADAPIMEEAFILPDFSSWAPSAQPGGIRSNFHDHAYWQPRLKSDKHGKATFEVTFPDDITSWETFVMVMNHKSQSGSHSSLIRAIQPLSAQLSLPRFLVAGDTAMVSGRLTSWLNDTLEVDTQFLLGDRQVQQGRQLFSQTASEFLELSSTETDSLKITYLGDYQGFTDGEERSIRVFPRGISKARGYYWYLPSDTTFTLSPGDFPSGEIRIYAKTNPLDVIYDDLERLIEFPYNCNEQEASRLIALLARKQLDEASGKRSRNEPLIRNTIRTLEKNQNSQGFWSWWSNYEPSSMWISEHVIRALKMARENGYVVNLERPLTRNMLLWEWENNPDERYHILNIMLMEAMDLPWEDFISQLNPSGRYCLSELRQLAGLQDASGILPFAERTLLGGMFFREESPIHSVPLFSIERMLRGNTFTNTLTAYRMLHREAALYHHILEPVFNYLLEERDASSAPSTWSTSMMIWSVMPSLLKLAAQPQVEAILEIQGDTLERHQDFPVSISWSGLPPTIRKSGANPLFLSAWQYYHIEEPLADENIIRVDTKFSGREANGVLETAREAILQLTITLEEAAEYLMVEVPIPAGCSYAENQAKGPFESHREQFREKTTLFFNQLYPGTFTYEIRLLPRFPGQYSLNPAKAELMYFPVFNANNAIKRVKITDQVIENISN